MPKPFFLRNSLAQFWIVSAGAPSIRPTRECGAISIVWEFISGGGPENCSVMRKRGIGCNGKQKVCDRCKFYHLCKPNISRTIKNSGFFYLCLPNEQCF